MVNTTVTRTLKPFGYRGTLTQPSLFYGREADLSEIAGKISQGQSVSILGLRGMGKSSLLSFLYKEYQNRPEWGLKDNSVLVFICIGELINLAGDQLLPYMVNEAARVRGLEPPKMDIQDATEWLEKHAQDGVQFVFLMDQFEEVAKIPDIEPRHFTYLRSLALSFPLVYVIESNRSLYDLSLSEGIKSSQFFNIFFEVILGAFTEDEARQMVFGRQDERKNFFTEDDFKHLYAITAWHPLVLSLACARIYDLRESGTEIDWEDIEERIVQETRHDYRYVWERDLNNAYRNILQKVYDASTTEVAELVREKSGKLKRLARMGLVLLTDESVEVVPGLRAIMDMKAALKESAKLDITQVEDLNSIAGIVGQIKNLLTGPVLDNYQGFVCALITGDDSHEVGLNDRGTPVVEADTPYRIVVWLHPDRGSSKFAEQIDIHNGQDSDVVNFEIALDCDTVKFSPRHQPVDAAPEEESRRISFDFTAPKSAGTHNIWVQVLQKNRLIQVVQLAMEVKQKGE